MRLRVAERVDLAVKTEGEATAVEIVRVELDFHVIAENNLDVMHSHLAGDSRFQLVTFVDFINQLDKELSIRESLHHSAECRNHFFIGFWCVLLFVADDLLLDFEVSCHKKLKPGDYTHRKEQKQTFATKSL